MPRRSSPGPPLRRWRSRAVGLTCPCSMILPLLHALRRPVRVSAHWCSWESTGTIAWVSMTRKSKRATKAAERKKKPRATAIWLEFDGNQFLSGISPPNERSELTFYETTMRTGSWSSRSASRSVLYITVPRDPRSSRARQRIRPTSSSTSIATSRIMTGFLPLTPTPGQSERKRFRLLEFFLCGTFRSRGHNGQLRCFRSHRLNCAMRECLPSASGGVISCGW